MSTGADAAFCFKYNVQRRHESSNDQHDDRGSRRLSSIGTELEVTMR